VSKKQKKAKLPRKSKLSGRLARLKLRQEQMPHDDPAQGLHYIKPGSMKK
jgi:hypothetical protein